MEEWGFPLLVGNSKFKEPQVVNFHDLLRLKPLAFGHEPLDSKPKQLLYLPVKPPFLRARFKFCH
jgi:hypothetical protein